MASFYSTLDGFSAFADLPQIHLEDHGSQYSNVQWSGYSSDYDTVLDDGYSFGASGLPTTRAITNFGDPRGNSIHRFMVDSSPWAPPGLSPGDIRGSDRDQNIFRHPVWNQPYETSFPSIYYPRQSSPAETSRSNSSVGSQSASQSDDMYSTRSPLRGTHLEVQAEAMPEFGLLSVRSPQLSPGGSCITLRDIQGFPDAEPEPTVEGFPPVDTTEEIGDNIYVRPRVDHQSDHYPQGHETQRLDHTIREAESVQPCSPPAMRDDEMEDPDYKPSSPSSPVNKRRRRRSSQSSNGYSTKTPIKKGNTHRRKTSSASANTNGIAKQRRFSNGHAANNGSSDVRPFPCPLAGYKCQSTFTSKNEWKRHVSTQHVRLGFWRCDLCPQPSGDGTYNDFNRKDLFTQHLRRMHVQALVDRSSKPKRQSSSPKSPTKEPVTIPEEIITETQKRCYLELRSAPPQSGCLFCPRTFTNWDERMEHVGSHFEKERKNGNNATSPENWRDDAVLRDWLIQEGLIEQVRKGEYTIGNGVPLRET